MTIAKLGVGVIANNPVIGSKVWDECVPDKCEFYSVRSITKDRLARYLLLLTRYRFVILGIWPSDFDNDRVIVRLCR